MTTQSGISNIEGGVYVLKWSHYETCMTSGLAELLEDEEYSMTDVTLACEGEFIRAHKIALAVSSPFFKTFFKMNRVEKAGTTLIALAKVKFKDLKNIIQFIYHGQVHVNNGDLDSFLEAANMLQIKGLDENSVGTNNANEVRFDSSITEPGRKRKRSRISTTCTPTSTNSTIPHVELPVLSNVPLPHTSLEDYSSMQNEDVEEGEVMINLDDVKPEPISVYSLNEDEEGEYVDNGGTSDLKESSNDEEVSYDDLNYTESTHAYDGPAGSSSVLVLSGVPCGVGGIVNSSNSALMKPEQGLSAPTASTSSTSSNDVTKTHGDGGEHYHSETQGLRYYCLCGTTFSQKCSLKRHISEMKGHKQVSCESCGKIFDRRRNLLRHQNKGTCANRLST